MKKSTIAISGILLTAILFTGCVEQPTPPELKANMTEQELHKYNKDNSEYQEQKSQYDAQNSTATTISIILGVIIGLSLAL